MITIEQLAKRCVGRLEEDKDAVIGVCGDEGDGKSSLMIQLAMAADPAFSLERNILYSPNFDEMKSKVVGLPKYSTIVADESIKSLYKLRWQSKLQQYINILYAICRQENKLTLLGMPRFTDFNEFFRQHRIKFWIQIIDPISRKKDVGHAVIFSRSWNPFSMDAWYFKDNLKLIDDYARTKRMKESEFDFDSKIYVLARSRNFVGLLKFGKMPENLFGQYTELKKKYAYDDLANSSDIEAKPSKREEKLSDRVSVLIKAMMASGRTAKEVGQLIGVTEGRIWQLLNKEPPQVVQNPNP